MMNTRALQISSQPVFPASWDSPESAMHMSENRTTVITAARIIEINTI